MAHNDRLILRIEQSPYSDITKGSVLSHSDLDNNLLFLKGDLIKTGITSGTTLVLVRNNNETINFELSGFGENYFTTGATLIGDVAYFDRTDALSAYTLDLSSLDINDTFLSGASFDENTLTLNLNDGSSVNTTWTGNTSGSCIDNFHVKNIHSCSPLFINPNDEGNVYIGSTSGFSIDINTGNTQVGINTSTPNYALQIGSGDLFVQNGSIGVNEAPDPTHRVRVSTNDTDGNNMTGARIDLSHVNSTGNFSGLQIRSTTTKTGGSSQIFGINSNITGSATAGAHTFIAGRFRAATTSSGGTVTNYGLQIQDGSEGTVGHVIKSLTTDGKARWGAIDASGISADTYVSGATFDGTDTIYFDRNDQLSAFTVDLSTLDVNDTFISGMTFNSGNYNLTIHRNDGVDFTENLSILSSDMVVTGGTYNILTGIVTFTNNSGNTFDVTGFTSGMTDSYTTTAYTTGNVIHFDNNVQGSDLYNVDLNELNLSAHSVDYGHIYFVSVSGNNSTAMVGNPQKPFATLSGAKVQAISDGFSDSVIKVYAGTYTDSDLVYENGTYDFDDGVIVNAPAVPSSASSTNIIFNIPSTGSVTNFKVLGNADFYIPSASDIADVGGTVMIVDNTATTFTFSFNDCTAERGVIFDFKNVNSGKVYGKSMSTTDEGIPMYVRDSGSLLVSIDDIDCSTDYSIWLDAGGASTYTGNLQFKSKNMNSLNSIATLSIGNGANVTFDVDNMVVNGTANGVSNLFQSGGRLRFNVCDIESAHRAYANFNCTSGDTFVHIGFAECENNILEINEGGNNKTFVTIKDKAISNINSGNNQGIRFATGGGGHLKLNGTIITTGSNAIPIGIDANTNAADLILENVTAIGNGTNSIGSTNPQNVKVTGRFASNLSLDSNITNIVTGSLIIIDSDITD